MTIVATGILVGEAIKAGELLAAEGIDARIINIHTIKPIDKELITECSNEYDLIVTVGEHNIIGGFGSAVSEVLSELPNGRARQIKIGLNDTYSCIVGSQKYLRNEYGMSAEKIAERIEMF